MAHACMRAAITVVAGLATTIAASTETIFVSADGGHALQHVIDGAALGDVVRLGPGEHRGPIVIDAPITLEGEPGAKLLGNDSGSVVTVTAARAVVRGLEISGSGTDIVATCVIGICAP